MARPFLRPSIMIVRFCAAPLIGPAILLIFAHTDGRPFDLFKKSCRGVLSFNVVALIDQRDPFGPGWQRVKIVRDKKGQVFKSVLSPLREQGVESLDDGKRWRTMLPDERVVIDQKSTRAELRSSAARLNLVRANYQFKLLGQSEVADHSCYRVEISPTCSQLPTWILYLESKTCYPLRVDTQKNGKTSVRFISRVIDFPKKLDCGLMSLNVPKDYKCETFDRPRDLTSATGLQKQLGFDPIIPPKLPFGFRTQDMQISRSDSWNTLIIRLGDGMARASVYEYLLGKGIHGMRPFLHSSQSQIGNTQIMIVSDISENCRRKLLSGFLTSNLK
jgi:hypothetical protein